MKPIWRLADENPGSDVGVTFAVPRAKDDLEGEPDIYVFSVHVWHAHTEHCQRFAEKLCNLLNAEGFEPPEGWLDE